MTKNDRGRFAVMLCLFFVSLVFGATAQAATFPDKPKDSHFYVDQANIITPADRTVIDQMAQALWQEKQIPLFVVTVDTLASFGASSLSAEDYARALFNAWGIGSKQRNYGILLFVSVGDRAARIQFGGGFGSAHDAQANDVMQSLLLPAFRRGDYSTGIRDGVKGLDSVARGLPLPTPTVPAWTWVVLLGGGVLFIALIVNLFKNGKSGWAWALIAAMGALLFFLFRNAGNSGGGGFGGGSSDGGGGASGSW